MKKITCLLMSMLFVLLLAACSSGNADSGAVSQPASMTVIDPGSTVEPPEPEPEPLNQAYLTGLEKGADYPEGQRVIAVQVGNTPGSRPSYGLSDAKILIECEANAGITRFLAIFEDYKTLPKVGSVRSARDPFVQLMIPSYAFFVHSGPAENQPARIMLQQYEYYGNYDLDGVHWTQSDRSTSIYSWYNTDAETVTKAIEKNNYDDRRPYNSPIFNFTPYTEPARQLADGAAEEVSVVHTSSFITNFAYNAGSGRYEMSQYNSSNGLVEKSIDANNNQQLSFDNVVVLFAPISVYPNTGSEQLAKVDFSNMGIGYYFNGGRYETIRWTKGAPDSPLRLYVNDTTETPLLVNPGTTYLGVVNDNRLEDFYNRVVTGQTVNQGEATGEVSEVD